MPQIADFNVHPLPPESDHTPLSFAFNYNHKNEVKVSGTPYISYKWNDNENTNKVADIFLALIDCTVQKNLKRKKWKSENNQPHNPWYDSDCKALRYSIASLNIECDQYKSKKLEYKNLIQNKKRNFTNSTIDKLNNENNSQKLWSILAEINPDTKDVLPIFRESFAKISYGIDYFDKKFDVSCIDFLAKYDGGHCQNSLNMIQSELLYGFFTQSETEHAINMLLYSILWTCVVSC